MMKPRIDLRAAMAQVTQATAADLTLAELVAAYCAVNFDTTDYMLRKWLDVFGQQSAWAIASTDLALAAEALQESGAYKPATINRDLSALGTVYKWAKRRRLCPPGFVSPTLAVPRFDEAPRVVSISPEEIKALLAGAHAVKDRRFAAYVALLHDTGCRKGELLARRWADVNLDKGEITVLETKTGRPRVLFFRPETAALMRRVWPKRAPDSLLFEGRVPGQPIEYRRHWVELTKAIGRPDLHQHDLRHHRAAELLKAGNTVAVAAQTLGHSSLILMRRYGHLETGHLKEAMKTSWEQAA